MVSLLEANEIPCFVHGGHLASVLPGLQIGSYNTATIMVPDSARQEAIDLLAVFSAQPETSSSPAPLGVLAKVRVVLEAAIFGWVVSQPPAYKDDGDEA